MSRRILVTDGEQRAALAVVRSLGRAGHEVWVCSERFRSLAGASRYARGSARVASPLENPVAFGLDVRRLCEQWRIEVLIPISEGALLTMLHPGAGVPGVALPFPTLDSFRAISDKRKVLEVAKTVGLEVPAQLVLEAREDARRLAPEAVHFPVVLKPGRTVAEEGDARFKVGVLHAADWGQLRSRLEALPDAAFPVLVQQRVVGPGAGIFLLMWDDEPRAIFAHRRLREKPPSGGVSVYCESVTPDPSLVKRAVELLRRFDWQGVAMVELKVDAMTGTAYVMEVNGRFWGSLQLAIDAGVDFPALLVDCAFGNAPERTPAFRAGIRSRWWWGDADHLIARLRRSRESLDLPADAPGRVRAVLDFLTFWRPGDRSEVFRLTDPAPMVRETFDWFARR